MEDSEPYDINFCFPVPEVLENERVKMRPFIPSRHAHQFIDAVTPYPEVFRYLPFGPYKDANDFVDNLIEPRIRRDPGYTLFVVFDKTKPSINASSDGILAGIIGLINTSAVHLATEIGCIMILPPFQRTHVASNAVGLLLQYGLNRPSEGGLGLRRVVWQANSQNTKSIKLAEKLGFKMEGVLRWDRLLPPGKEAGNGLEIRTSDPKQEFIGRDTAMLGLYWDDWEHCGKEILNVVMARAMLPRYLAERSRRNNAMLFLAAVKSLFTDE